MDPRAKGLIVLVGAVAMGCGGRGVSVGSPAGTGTPAAADGVDARAAVSGRFYLVMGRDTFVAERYTRSAERIEGEYTDRVRGPRVTFAAVVAPDASITRLETRTWVRGSTSTTGDSTRVVTFAGDSIRVEENGRVRWVLGGRGAQLVLGPSGAFLEQLLLRARRRDSVKLRVFEASGRGVQTLTFHWADDLNASATSDGDANQTVFHLLAPGLVQSVIYPAPKGMQIVRGEGRR